MLPPEERQRPEVINPMCEVFPKVAACNYHRYGMGGRVDGRNAICILGLNMINDKVRGKKKVQVYFVDQQRSSMVIRWEWMGI